MNRLVLPALLLLLGSTPALAQTVEDVNSSIETVLGDHTRYEEAFDTLQAAVAAHDADMVSDLVSYPITVTESGEAVTLDGPEAFIAQYDTIMTDEITKAVLEQKYETLFVNAQGVMFGDGQVWLNGICKDDACSDFDVKIITIQSTAQ